MTIELCDICGQPLGQVYEDENYKLWCDVSFQEKKYRKLHCLFGDSWTEYISVCGKCRAALAKQHKETVTDTVSVIRCKDCKWFGDLGCAIKVVDDTDRPKENDFCSFGERKEK